MGNPLGNYKGIQTLEHDVTEIQGFIALDGSSNVIGTLPTNAAPGTGFYTRLLGLQRAIGIAGAIKTQPHQSAGLYYFTLDEAWNALLDWSVEMYDQGAVAQLTPSVIANVRANVNGPYAGNLPGTNTGLTNPAIQIVQVRFRIAAGTLTDPVASTGFWMKLKLMRTAVL